jgi:sugar lactone lactonase YvrE
LLTSYPNDVRFDLRRGAEGMAFITDSGGSNGVIVVDLATGRSWRRLAGHPSVLADEGFLPVIEGEPFTVRPAGGEPTSYETGSDGIALSADGRRLYYCPLSSRRLHSVSTDALADPDATDAEVAATVENLGFKRWPTAWRATRRGGSTAATWNTTPSGAGARTAPTGPSPREAT